MKQYLSSVWTKITMVVMMALANVCAYAQDGGAEIDVNITKDGGEWYANPWMWIVGAAVFILLLVAIVRGGSRTSD